MADYKFDGTYLEQKGRKIAKVSGDYIEDYQNGQRKIAKLDGEHILDYQNGQRRIAKIDELKKQVDGYPSKMQLLAMWWFFIR